MKFNNTYNLPGPLATALQADNYDLKNCPENVISLTTLIGPPKAKILESRHYDELEIDVSECFWRVLGTACHTVMEDATKGLDMAEMRWFMEMATKTLNITSGRPEQEKWWNPESIYVSGKIDIYQPEEKKLSDYKITSVWSWLLEKKMKPEHEMQLQINGLAMKSIGHAVEKLSVVMMFRDWSKLKNGEDLPVPFKEIFTDLWKPEDVLAYIDQRVKLHYEARKLKDDEIPECNPEERWARPTIYAVMKPGRKSSVKNFDKKPTPEQMREFPGCTIQERPGEDAKCCNYCVAGPKYCSYYKSVYGIKTIPIEEDSY